jgi:uncharacterized membrane protein
MKRFKNLKGYIKRKYPHIILVCLLFIVSMALGAPLPGRVALHWDRDGIVDRYGSKYELVFLLPVVSVIIFIIGAAAEKRFVLPSHKVKGAISFFQFFFILLVFVLQLYKVFRAMNFPVGLESLSAVLFVALFIYMGNVIKSSEYRSAFGIKTKWTMDDPDVWEKTSRLAAILLNIAAGSMIAVVFLPGLMVALIIAEVAVIGVVLPLYSRIISGRKGVK